MPKKTKSAKLKAGRLPNGRTMQTYDDYIEGNHGAEHKERRVVIIDGNERKEYAIVPLTSQKTPNTSPLQDYASPNGKKTHFRHFVATADDEGQPIKRARSSKRILVCSMSAQTTCIALKARH